MEVSCEHPFAISMTLASVILQPQRLIESSCEHPFASSMTLASVILLQLWRPIERSCEHPFAISVTLVSVILRIWMWKYCVNTKRFHW